MHMLVLGGFNTARVRGDTSAVLENCLTWCDNAFTFGLLMIRRQAGFRRLAAPVGMLLSLRLLKENPHQLPHVVRTFCAGVWDCVSAVDPDRRSPEPNRQPYNRSEVHDVRRSCQTVLSPLIATVLVLFGSQRNNAQVLVPPSASLDVQVTAAPQPVRIGGRLHLAYELHITNFRVVDLALTRIEVLGDVRSSAPLANYQDADLRTGLAKAGARPDVSDKRVIAGGMRDVFYIWLTLDEATPVPSTLDHRISFNVLGPTGSETGVVECGHVDVRRDAPIVLDAPLRGGPWVAVYDPSNVGGHRRALFAIKGRARIPSRFAIDWIKLGDDGHASRGEATTLSNFHGYGAEVLAVADASVVDVADGLREPTVPITLDNSGGNYVTLDLGGGRFAFYEHLQPGSIKVKVGDRVRSGQVLALVGASGSVSSGPHLHFHVSDTNSPLGAEGLPYVFRSFEAVGAFESLEALASGKQWVPAPSERVTTRRMEMPLQQTVVRF
jgi:murein DD-endopeptidase